MLLSWDEHSTNQASYVPCIIIFFHNFLQNSLQKPFQFIFLYFYNFTKVKINNFECPQPIVLFLIYQNNTWTIRRLVNETIDPAIQHIILKIIGFLM